ncbi:winged helix-turn-helix domain-containing protein [Luxibacter massiliensis]|uniref:winged helix-turn-helix domain-containing protein n=1 Tax=Luxibacter massiliensis TaxID=2219695 RepID=UPI000F068F0B|nr:winged helix-turn-helix domain-containing protein [Luxibacter massiliensis]
MIGVIAIYVPGDEEKRLFSKIQNILDKENYIQAEEGGTNLVFERLKIIPDYHKILLDDKEVNLSSQQFQLLLYLAKKPGRVYTYEQIYETIWEKEYTYDKGNVMAR